MIRMFLHLHEQYRCSLEVYVRMYCKNLIGWEIFTLILYLGISD